MTHFPFKVVSGPGDKPMIEGAPLVPAYTKQQQLPPLGCRWAAAAAAAAGTSGPRTPLDTPAPLAPISPLATVEFKGEAKQFSAEEVSSMVLVKMREVAET